MARGTERETICLLMVDRSVVRCEIKFFCSTDLLVRLSFSSPLLHWSVTHRNVRIERHLILSEGRSESTRRVFIESQLEKKATGDHNDDDDQHSTTSSSSMARLV